MGGIQVPRKTINFQFCSCEHYTLVLISKFDVLNQLFQACTGTQDYSNSVEILRTIVGENGARDPPILVEGIPTPVPALD